jgi:hypothetical protein
MRLCGEGRGFMHTSCVVELSALLCRHISHVHRCRSYVSQSISATTTFHYSRYNDTRPSQVYQMHIFNWKVRSYVSELQIGQSPPTFACATKEILAKVVGCARKAKLRVVATPSYDATGFYSLLPEGSKCVYLLAIVLCGRISWQKRKEARMGPTCPISWLREGGGGRWGMVISAMVLCRGYSETGFGHSRWAATTLINPRIVL